MNISSVFITSDKVLTVWYFHLQAITSELIQSKSALNQRWSALENLMFQNLKNQLWTALVQSWFYLKQHWFFQLWTALISFETELISADVFHIFWALKNVNSLTQRCSELIICGTATRDAIKERYHRHNSSYILELIKYKKHLRTSKIAIFTCYLAWNWYF